MTEYQDLPIAFVSLDFETTGLELAAGNVAIEVGLSVRPAERGSIHTFESRIFHPAGSFTWHPKAFEVNGFTLEQISDPNVAQLPELVDGQACAFLEDLSGFRLIPLGWNVGSFDWPFALATLPHMAAMFTDQYGHPGHQFADLNSMLFMLHATGYQRTKSAISRAVAKQAEANGVEVNWHSAGFDSYAALLTFEEFVKAIAILGPLAPDVECYQCEVLGENCIAHGGRR